jgi:uncharacterized protein (DUF362 family)/ferredoxin
MATWRVDIPAHPGDLARFVDLRPAWTRAEIEATVRDLLDQHADRLPGRADSIFIKPNLNNDLIALTGNSTDLRVLGAVLGALRDLGYPRVVVGDGPNVGVERRRIDVFRRLRVDRLCARFGVEVVDLNRDAGRPVPLANGAPRLAVRALDADFYLSLPKVKTHAEAVLSSACKNQVGLCVAQDKREVHRDLFANIPHLVAARSPDLVLVDAVVGMGGNGPGDGEPVALGHLILASDAWTSDLAVCRAVGLDWEAVPYLAIANRESRFPPSLPEALAGVPRIAALPVAPPRSRLARAADDPRLFWLKRLVRPLVSRPLVAEVARRLHVIQDVYRLDDDGITGVHRSRTACGACTVCADVCPTGLTVAEIGVKTDPEACIACGYCHWACPDDVIALVGPPNALGPQLDRHRDRVRQLRRPTSPSRPQ